MTVEEAYVPVQLLAPGVAVVAYFPAGRLTLVVSAIGAAALLLWARQVAEIGCSINESECQGTGAFVLLVLLLWVVAGIVTIGHAIYQVLRGAN